MIKKRVTAIGAGITLFRRRMLETGREMCWEAAKMALDASGLTLKDIDCVVMGTAPDAFDGQHMKAEYLLDGAGGWRKPYYRVYVGGGTGVFAPIAGWWHIASGLFDTCLVVAEEKMSPTHPHPQYAFSTIWDPILTRPLEPNLIWIFALEMHRYMYKYGIKKEDIAAVAVKNKRNAMDHPCAQIPAEITIEDVLNSEVLVWPVQRLDISPVSDGAAAMILCSEDVAKKQTDSPVWIDGVAYRMAGIKNPPKEIDLAEVYDPFDYKELHHMEGLQLARKGEAPKLTKEGVTARDGDLPINPSGGLLGVGNPIAAAGMMKVCEIFWQLRGEAGKRQVQNARTGLAQAWGDLMQVGTVTVMRS